MIYSLFLLQAVFFGLLNLDCYPVTGITELSCVLAPGSGSSLVLQAVNGVMASLVLPLISYAGPLVTNMVHPHCLYPSNLEPQDPQLVNCPREGGGCLTLTGLNFGVANAVVLIGSLPCLGLTHGALPSSQVSCDLPSGTSMSSAVTFIQDGGKFSQGPLVSYVQCDPGTFQTERP